MNAHTIHAMALASLSGILPFPNIVKHLIEEGVEYYHVDYITRRFTFYNGEGDVVIAPLTMEHLPSVASDFNVEALRAAIMGSQQYGKTFTTKPLHSKPVLYRLPSSGYFLSHQESSS